MNDLQNMVGQLMDPAGGLEQSLKNFTLSFVRPAYDSGWRQIAPGQIMTLHHGLGGDTADYAVVVDGGNYVPYLVHSGWNRFRKLVGLSWGFLNNATIDVVRDASDDLYVYARVRIWKLTSPEAGPPMGTGSAK